MKNVTKSQVIAALQKKGPPIAIDGYVQHPQDNLIEGVFLRQFESDLQKGAGNELQNKFLAVHSSTALVVNVFAPFKDSLAPLTVIEKTHFTFLQFERECRTGIRGGTPPHLDVWLERDKEVLGIESKLTEYFGRGSAEYTDTYQRSRFPHAEDCWWDVLESSKTAAKTNLDLAQLVKHYLGLVHYSSSEQQSSVGLHYLYWEPVNADEIQACVDHRGQIAALSEQVKASRIRFSHQSYNELWKEWSQRENLREHVDRLRARYGVEV